MTTDTMQVTAASDYAASGFGRRLGFGSKPALIVIDFVER